MNVKRCWIWGPVLGLVLAAGGFVVGRLTAPPESSVEIHAPMTIIYDGSQYPSIAYEEANRALAKRLEEIERDWKDSRLFDAVVIPMGLGAYQMRISGFQVTDEEDEELSQLAREVLDRHERISRIISPDGEFLTHPPDR